MKEFKLSDNFIEKYKRRTPPFGFNGLGQFVYMRTYSRRKKDGNNERWWETVRRVVEGTYNIQRKHIEKYSLGWDARKAHVSAKEMYDRIYNIKFLPPGRGLWAMGTDIIEDKNLFAALNNCAFVSTGSIDKDLSKPFSFLMDMSMLGVGVGFDTKGDGQLTIQSPDQDRSSIYDIPDTREGWVNSLSFLLTSYFIKNQGEINFNYDKIRPKGELIKTFGGMASGPEPLIELHTLIRELFNEREGDALTSRDIVDIMNMIGKTVVAGNVRRTAEIALGSINDDSFLNLKNYKQNPERSSYGWTSNNSVLADLGDNYETSAKLTGENGEPGYVWLENIRKYGRLIDPPNWKDIRAEGTNPCGEQSLESYELCCLTETFPNNHESLEDYLRTLKFAYLYAKTVTLGKTHWSETNRVLLRNRRIGCSQTGIVQFISKHGIDEFKRWCEEGYAEIQKWDKIHSDWFAIPRSIKTTSIKPSGTVSLLGGATPGMHYPESRYYIRRVRLSEESPLLQPLIDANYKIEQDVNDKYTKVVEFPVFVGENVPTINEISMWDQVMLSEFLQRYWSDNQVSCTVTFKDHERDHIPNLLNNIQYTTKAISFLPKTNKEVYPQMPYEEITKEKYEELSTSVKRIRFTKVKDNIPKVEMFCSNDMCTIL